MESLKIVNNTEGERAIDAFTKQLTDLKSTMVELFAHLTFKITKNDFRKHCILMKTTRLHKFQEV